MVAIVAGNGLGLFNTSLNILGGAGVMGQSVLGQAGSRSFVNAATGNLILQMQDEQLSGRGLDLQHLRTYNSLGALNDADADGWRWGYEQTVKFQGPGTPGQPQANATVIRTDGDGHETTYTWNGSRYVSSEGSGAHDSLSYDSAALEWVWTDETSRVVERYSNSTSSTMTGRLIKQLDPSGNSITLSYDASGRLTNVRDTASQQELKLTYALFSGVTKLQKVETRALADDGTLGSFIKQVEYGYTNGRLTLVKTDLTPGNTADDGDPTKSYTTNYTYNAAGRVESVTQGDGTSVFFTYYTDGKVATVKDNSSATSNQFEFTYGTNQTTIKDGNGQAWTYKYDAITQQLTEIVTPNVGGAALSTKFEYDASGNVFRVTDARGNQVTYGYDANGNRTLERDALGNTLTRTFNAQNQVVTETRYKTPDPDGAGSLSASDPLTTRYVYDASGTRLRYVVSAEGRVSESRYGSSGNSAGLLTQTLQYTASVYDVSGLSETTAPTLTQLDSWVSGLADKSQVQITQFAYDLRGNLSKQTSYATADASGAGVLNAATSVTEYVYDPHGNLLQTIAVRGVNRDQRTTLTSLVYDGLGRVQTSTSANGTQTTVYDGANSRVQITTASGLVETRSYDVRGRLISVSQAGDNTARLTKYVYNNADQLRMMEDALGNRRFSFYDVAGRLEFAVDGTGAVTRFAYNATGQLTAQTLYAKRVTPEAMAGWYDATSGTVGKLTLSVGASGTDVQTDASLDRITSYAYDNAGRLVTVTDAANTVTTTTYDGASRVTATQTVDRVTRYFYDQDDRKVGMLDALGYLTEYKYDAAGRLTETVRYSERSPGAIDRTAPVWIGVTNQTATGTRPFEYRVPAFDADGDSLTFSVVGTLPMWLTLDTSTATPTLRGTPPATLTNYSVTLRADDGRGKTSDVTMQITVVNSPPSWVDLPDVTVMFNSGNFSLVLPSASDIESQVAQLKYSFLSPLPAGLSFDAAQRKLSGTPAEPGVYVLTARVKDPQGLFVDKSFTLTVTNGGATNSTGSGFVMPDAQGPGGAAAPSSGSNVAVNLPPNWGTSAPMMAGGGSPADLEGPAPLSPDPLSDVRPTGTGAQHSYLYYDGQGRVIGAVDAQQFLTETVYDEQLHTQQTLRYLTPVSVAQGDTLSSLKTRSGTFEQTSLVEYDGFGRVSLTTAPDGLTKTRNVYDAAGRLVRVVAAEDYSEQRGNRTRYNAFGEVTGTLGGVGDATLSATPTQQQIDDAIATYGMRHEYDAGGRVVRSIDANGNKTLFYYDRENRLTHTVRVVGQAADNTLGGEVSETVFNAFGQAESVRSYATRLSDADMDQLLANGGGGMADPTFLNRIASLANASLDQRTSYAYDRRGLLVTQTDAESAVTTNTYSVYGQLATQVRSILQGQSTTAQFDYDLRGALVSQTGDVGGINANSRTVYDAFGRVIQSIDGTGRITTTSYQDSGRTVEVSDPLNRTVRSTYDAFARVLTVTDALGQVTTYTYDDQQKSVRVTTPEGIEIQTLKTKFGETSFVFSSSGSTTSYRYDKDGHLTEVRDALQQKITRNEYDKSGRLFRTTDARGTVTEFSYDQLNRVIEKRVDPSGLNLKTRYEFNALGQQVTVTAAADTNAAQVTRYEFDRAGRLTRSIVDPNGLQLSTHYGYDDLGNTLRVEQGTLSNQSQQVTLYEFDKLGRRVKEIAAPSAVFGAGAPGTRDLTTEYRYDAAGRVSRRIDAGGQSTWYVYDAAGQQTYVINDLGEVSESNYDAAGRLSHERRYYTRTTAYLGFGDVVSTFTPPAVHGDDQRTFHVYDKDGRERFKVWADNSTNWAISESRYDANGNVIETRRYDKFLLEPRVNAIDTADSPGISIAEITGELVTLGYLDTESTLANVQRTRFVYDPNNRLRFTVDGLGSVSENVYDAAGSAVASIRYATRPTLTQYTEGAIDAAVDRSNVDNQVSHFVYDAAGRLRFSLQALETDPYGTRDLVTEHTYDALGRIVRTTAYAKRAITLNDYRLANISSAIRSDAQDRRSAFAYDAAGRQVYSVQELASDQHVVSKVEYDALGRVVKDTAYATLMALADFNKATLDAATGDPNHLSAQDRTTEFVYDAAGRQRFAVAADGSLSENIYNALGQVRETRRFYLRVNATTLRTEADLSALRTNRAVGDGITRGEKYTYDRAGRLRTTTDAKGFVETNAYNGLGQRVVYTNKNGATWTYFYDRVNRLFREQTQPLKYQLSNETAPPATDRRLETRYNYDALGNLRSKVEANTLVDARTTEFSYDRLGRLTATTLPGWYDPATGKVVSASATGRFRREVQVTYDQLGNEVRTRTRTGPGANDYQYEYKTFDRLGRLVHDVDAMKQVTAFTYTSFCEQRQVTRHSVTITGTPANANYWTLAEIASRISGDTDSRTITTSYDNLGRKTEITQPVSSSYYFSSSAPGVNAGAVQTVFGAPTTRYEYNVFGEVHRERVRITDTEWRDTWHYHDQMGREVRTVFLLLEPGDLDVPAGGYHTAYSYDPFGNRVQTVEYATLGPSGTSGDFAVPGAPPESSDDRITGFGYDALNRQTSVRRYGLRYADAAGNLVSSARIEPVTVESTTYDGVGNVQTRTDALGNTTTFEYNVLGQMTKMTEPARTTAGTGLDPFLNQVTASPVTTMTLDAFGSVVRTERDPGAGAGSILVTQQGYDAAGNIISSTDANGNVKQRQVDYAGRVVKETQAIDVATSAALGGRTIHTIERRYAYDAVGRQIAVLDAYMDGAILTQSGQRSVYNAFGEVKEERRVFGAASATLDTLDSTSVIVASYTYDSVGHVIEKTAADGTTHYFYDLTGQVTRQEQRGNGSDADGTGTHITETAYNRLGQAVIQRQPRFIAQVPAGNSVTLKDATPFTLQRFDRWGNVTQRSVGGYTEILGTVNTALQSTTTYVYNHDNQVISETQPPVTAVRADGTSYNAAVSHELRYDLLGRAVLERDVADDASTLQVEANPLRARTRQYNSVGQLISETDATNITTQYAYDAHGNRVGTKNAAGTVFVDTFDKNGNVLSHSVLRLAANGVDPYVSGSGQAPTAVALQRYKYDQANRRYSTEDVAPFTGGVSLTKYDERNLVRANSNAEGIATFCSYDPFGNKLTETDASGNTQSWSYSSNPYSVGRLVSMTVGGKTTNYEYNDFGQISREGYAGSTNERTYSYHLNGLLRQTQDRIELGTAGLSGGVDYFSTTDVTQYDYTVKGELAREQFTRTGAQDVLEHDPEPGVPDRIVVEPLPSIARTTYTSYDALGRMTRVQESGGQNSGGTLQDLEYSYDELGNIRDIYTQYTLVGGSSGASDTWFAYDAEGRMTIADGVLDGNMIKAGDTGTKITYDALGRRATTERKDGGGSFTTGTIGEVNEVTTRWNEYRLESFEYDDLSHLKTLWQRIDYRDTIQTIWASDLDIPLADVSTPWFYKETRNVDSLGYVRYREVYESIRTQENADRVITGAPFVETTISSDYRRDGQLQSQTLNNLFTNTYAVTTYLYDNAGILTKHIDRRDISTNKDETREVIDTFTHTYSMEAGGLKERTISVSRVGGEAGTTPGNTTNSYDSRGRLVKVDIANPVERTTRTFSYDSADRIIAMNERDAQSGSISKGSLGQFYANGRQVATLGDGALSGVRRFSFAYTPISATNTNPNSYTVRAGDTLAGIAKELYGDSALWYLIADANSVNFATDQALPTTEVGKNYRIPSVVNSHNNANTFKPYSPAEIIGNTTPSPGHPVPPEQCSGVQRVLASAVVVAVSVAVSSLVAYGTGGLGAGLGGAAGNLAGQTAGWALGLQDGVEWDKVGMAGAQGLLSAGLSNAMKAADAGAGAIRATTATTQFLTGEVLNNFSGWDTEGGVQSGLFNLGLSLAGAAWGGNLDQGNFKWSGAATQLANATFNPQSGLLFNPESRNWTNIATQALGAFTSVAVGAGVDWMMKDDPQPIAQQAQRRRDAAAFKQQFDGFKRNVAGAYGLDASDLQLDDGSSEHQLVRRSDLARILTSLTVDRRLEAALERVRQGGSYSGGPDWSELTEEQAYDREEANRSYREFAHGVKAWWSKLETFVPKDPRGVTTTYFDTAGPSIMQWDGQAIREHHERLPTYLASIVNSTDMEIAERAGDTTWIEALQGEVRRRQWQELKEYQLQAEAANIVADVTGRSLEEVLDGEDAIGFAKGMALSLAEPLAEIGDAMRYVGRPIVVTDKGVELGKVKLYSQYAQQLAITKGIREQLQGKSGIGLEGFELVAKRIAASAAMFHPYAALAAAGYSTGNTVATAIDHGGLTSGEWGALAGSAIMALGFNRLANARLPLGSLTRPVYNFMRGSNKASGLIQEAKAYWDAWAREPTVVVEPQSIFNTSDGKTNCMPATRNVDRFLEGGPVVSAPDIDAPATTLSSFPVYFGRRPDALTIEFNTGDPATNLANMEKFIEAMGPGTKYVIRGDYHPHLDGIVTKGHVFNAANPYGKAVILDGQKALVGSTEIFRNQLMRYHGGLTLMPMGELKVWIPSFFSSPGP